MPMDDFYTVIELDETVDPDPGQQERGLKKFRIIVRLNPDHPVYGGHFPGNPVVPGVCQVQMIQELSSFVLNKELRFSKSDNIKFLSMIRPSDEPNLTVSMDIRETDPGCWNVTASISSEEKVFLKFKGILIPEKN